MLVSTCMSVYTHVCTHTIIIYTHSKKILRNSNLSLSPRGPAVIMDDQGPSGHKAASRDPCQQPVACPIDRAPILIGEYVGQSWLH